MSFFYNLFLSKIIPHYYGQRPSRFQNLRPDWSAPCACVCVYSSRELNIIWKRKKKLPAINVKLLFSFTVWLQSWFVCVALYLIYLYMLLLKYTRCRDHFEKEQLGANCCSLCCNGPTANNILKRIFAQVKRKKLVRQRNTRQNCYCYCCCWVVDFFVLYISLYSPCYCYYYADLRHFFFCVVVRVIVAIYTYLPSFCLCRSFFGSVTERVTKNQLQIKNIKIENFTRSLEVALNKPHI